MGISKRLSYVVCYLQANVLAPDEQQKLQWTEGHCQQYMLWLTKYSNLWRKELPE